jgi:hypothetical protein
LRGGCAIKRLRSREECRPAHNAGIRAR